MPGEFGDVPTIAQLAIDLDRRSILQPHRQAWRETVNELENAGGHLTPSRGGGADRVFAMTTVAAAP